MPNTHAIADSLNELMCTWGDLGPQVIVSHSGLTVPASSLTLAAVAANGYVRAAGPPARLVYVSQPAVSITLSATNGNWWLALHGDLSTPVAGWTRRSGSHYLVQQAATQPANPSGGLVFAQVTVSGGVISAVSPLLPVTSQPMSQQNSKAVAITGGTATGLETVTVIDRGQNNAAFYTNLPSGGSKASFYGAGTAPSYFGGTVQVQDRMGVHSAPGASDACTLFQQRAAGENALVIRAQGNDSGGYAGQFYNAAGTTIGTIYCNATTTAYNTSSDVRLKENIATLLGALARIQALRPVSFRWQADGSLGEGFLAHELQQDIPLAVTGLPDEVNADGSVKPQQVDASKIIVHLVGAVQELAAQVQTLTTRIHTLEEALGG